MARTSIESEFARALGRIGENEIAPALLLNAGMTECRNLNLTRMHFPWADYVGRLNGEWVAIAVRTRFNWTKPRPRVPSFQTRGFNGAGARLATKAVEMIRAHLAIPPLTPIRLLWLAIVVDLDDTFEAYWGDYAEMRTIKRATGDHRLRILMAPTDRARYAREGRCLAFRKRCGVSIPWESYPDEWACPAHKRYRLLDEIPDRDERIRTAIGGVVTSSPVTS